MNKLIFYLHNKSFKASDNIYDKIIPNLPEHINLNNRFLNLFESIKSLKIEQLIEVYEYIELQCFEIFKDNLDKKYQTEIPKNIIKLIINEIEAIEKKSKLTKLILGKAIRKFICRYLCGKREDTLFHINSSIFEILETRSDIWDNEFLNSNNYEQIITELKNKKIFMDLKLQFILDFYNILECDEKLKISKENIIQNVNVRHGKKNKKKKKDFDEDDDDEFGLQEF